MKKMLWLLCGLIILIGTNLSARETSDSAVTPPDTIAWFHDFDSAQALALNEGRYMLVEFYADW